VIIASMLRLAVMLAALAAAVVAKDPAEGWMVRPPSP